MRDLMTAAMALIMALVAGLALGWHWRGSSFEQEASRLRAEIEAREAAKRADIERSLAYERNRATVAERMATAADTEKTEAVDRLARSAATDVEIVNQQLAEVFK